MPPEIYSKDCKIKVIEYGAEETPADLLKDLKSAISDCIHKLTH